MQLEEKLNLIRTISESAETFNQLETIIMNLHDYVFDSECKLKFDSSDHLLNFINNFFNDEIENFTNHEITTTGFLTQYDSAYIQLLYAFKESINDYYSYQDKYLKNSHTWNRLSKLDLDQDKINLEILQFILIIQLDMMGNLMEFVNF